MYLCVCVIVLCVHIHFLCVCTHKIFIIIQKNSVNRSQRPTNTTRCSMNECPGVWWDFLYFEDNANSLSHCHSLHLGKERQPGRLGTLHAGTSTFRKTNEQKKQSRQPGASSVKAPMNNFGKLTEGTYLPDDDSCGSRGSDTATAGPSRNLLKNWIHSHGAERSLAAFFPSVRETKSTFEAMTLKAFAGPPPHTHTALAFLLERSLFPFLPKKKKKNCLRKRGFAVCREIKHF